MGTQLKNDHGQISSARHEVLHLKPDMSEHLTLRTRIKRLARKPLCFSNSVFRHDTVIGLCVNRYEFGTPV
jgi:insertion element IS1 protein InsB